MPIARPPLSAFRLPLSVLLVVFLPLPPPVLRAAPLRVLEGRHLRLVTDLPSRPEVDQLPAVFDQAVPQWAAYFQVDPARLDGWQVVGYLMADKDRFTASGLLPADLPPFPHAFQRGRKVWVYRQESDYYQRHLLLHEGTHAVMLELLGGTGPPWYMEGMAELLATHRWADGQLHLGTMPQDRDEVPLWGRIKLVRDQVQAGSPLALTQVVHFGPRAHQQVEAYGWCWAACLLLDRHPAFQQAFRALHEQADADPADFNRQVERMVEASDGAMEQAWQAMLGDLDYGYSVQEGAFGNAPAHPLPSGGWRITVAANRSWQRTGVRLEASTEYEFAAQGRFIVARQEGDWQCEPQGVTIRYHRGRPLGELTAAVVPETTDPGSPPGGSAWLHPYPIGRQARLRPSQGGILYLRINEMPGDLEDNQGTLQVGVRPAAAN